MKNPIQNVTDYVSYSTKSFQLNGGYIYEYFLIGA